jgi:hypothetical protein
MPPLRRDGSETGTDGSGEGSGDASGPSKVDSDGRPTLQLSPVEIEALAQSSLEARPIHDDIRTTLTVENVRLALGSTSMPPARLDPEGPEWPEGPDASEGPDALDAPDLSDRGPRRARETLRVETITAQSDTLAPLPRKR